MALQLPAQAEIIPVQMDKIDGGSHGPFSMSYAFDPGPLILSIKNAGLINPPILRKDEQGKLDIVAGYRRVEALKSLAWRQVPCKILPAETPLPDCLLLNLYDNLTVRTFNDVEKSMVLNRLMPFVSQKRLVEYFLPLLDLQPRISILDYYIALEKLESPLKIGVAGQRLSTQTVRALQDMGEDTRITLAEWILNLNLNFNQQRQFIEYITDISIRDEVSVPDLLNREPMLEIALEVGSNLPQKARRVLEYLRNQRFPRLSKIEKNFQERISRMRLPKWVGIHHPPYFEGSDYLLEIKFKDGRTLLQKIHELAVVDELENICDPDLNHEPG